MVDVGNWEFAEFATDVNDNEKAQVTSVPNGCIAQGKSACAGPLTFYTGGTAVGFSGNNCVHSFCSNVQCSNAVSLQTLH